MLKYHYCAVPLPLMCWHNYKKHGAECEIPEYNLLNLLKGVRLWLFCKVPRVEKFKPEQFQRHIYKTNDSSSSYVIRHKSRATKKAGLYLLE